MNEMSVKKMLSKKREKGLGVTILQALNWRGAPLLLTLSA